MKKVLLTTACLLACLLRIFGKDRSTCPYHREYTAGSRSKHAAHLRHICTCLSMLCFCRGPVQVLRGKDFMRTCACLLCMLCCLDWCI